MPKSFTPIISENSRIIIIGTMPSVESLNRQEYYAHPQNHFWKIISILFHNGKKWESFTEKKQCLLENGIGLWDALASCHREGSLDCNIIDERPNNFKKLFKDYNNIEHILFNGNKAFHFFKKYNKNIIDRITYTILPSTSPANARFSFEDKLKEWSIIKNILLLDTK